MLLVRLIVLGTLGGDVPHPALVVGSWAVRERLALATAVQTLGALLLPRSAPIDVAPPLAEASAPSLVLTTMGVVVVAATCVIVVRHFIRPSVATLAVAIAAFTIAPTANLLFASGVVLAGRTLYSPSIGVALLGGALASLVLAAQPPVIRRSAIGLLACWGTAALVVSARDVGIWRDSDQVSAAMRLMTVYRKMWQGRLALVTTLAGVASSGHNLPAQTVDYATADRIRTFDPLLVGGRVYPVWFSDSVRFYYEANGSAADRGTLYLVDSRARTRRPLIDNGRVAASLSAAADTSIDSHKLPAATLVNGDRALQFDIRGKSYWCPLDAPQCVVADSAQLMRFIKAQVVAHRHDRPVAERAPGDVQRVGKAMPRALGVELGPEERDEPIASDRRVWRHAENRQERETASLRDLSGDRPVRIR